MRSITLAVTALAFVLVLGSPSAEARDIEYRDSEVTVRVAPGEPTQMQFPGEIAGGFRKRQSSLSLDPEGSDLIVFANEQLSDDGEAIIVRLEDDRSFSLRIKRATPEAPRDDLVRLIDEDRSFLGYEEEEEAPYRRKQFDKAPANMVSGFMREMVLVEEFGKKKIPGYRRSDRYEGEAILDDGTLIAKVDSIYIGPNYWGYVIEAENQLDEAQYLNPATFRLDGTRAISLTNWELAPKPLNVEQQVAGKHKTKIYVITKPRK